QDREPMAAVPMVKESMWDNPSIRSICPVWRKEKAKMARLPIPNSDGDSWGDVLNEFLLVSHHEDGTLRGVAEVTNVQDFGATGDGTTDDMAAIAAALDTAPHCLFFPPGVYRIGASITLAVPLHFACGAVLKPDAGVTVTLQGAILAQPDQVIFDV